MPEVRRAGRDPARQSEHARFEVRRDAGGTVGHVEEAARGNFPFGRAAGFFWRTVTERRTFATGGNGDAEHFFDPAHVAAHLSAETAETCNVYNMLKLSHALFAADPRPAYADYVELGGESGARDAGKLRAEGKEYVVQDGDLMLFRFNV